MLLVGPGGEIHWGLCYWFWLLSNGVLCVIVIVRTDKIVDAETRQLVDSVPGIDERARNLLADLPIAELLRVARGRNQILKEKYGAYAAQKKFKACPKCGERCGVRELQRRHVCSTKATK